MDKQIGICGLTCTACPAFIATQNKDVEAMSKVAEQWSVEYDTQLTPADCWCNGCHSESGPWMAHCSVCKIRACGNEKAVENCAHCDEYACDKLTEFFSFVPDAKTLLDEIRAEL